ncbi:MULTISPECIES: hypothetical protein [Mobiluncus]|jgi:hypothetical protein|uniref:Uncharacterized protein n=1 Tax=Mobiluncus curtisii ATCC 51333 TaxID=887326 RepID=E6LYF5_9ACTO|nr:MULTISPECIES: hypothetical protein [Mobiluncus]EFL94160.1 hypothetical protein HMPREF0574_0482 [Mobiluncus curtisii subsp. curtisii ATCC 35241]EFU80198.1 hypothetical protein HMPREF0388_0892 [Mobiluncus curtisii ATCC 51333]MCU9987883.1 hypothetical protein [Mobiluncus curtisii]MCV0000834.1 hypothetical protein [Mobiluncus curtisii]MCV0021531.1 hypothetical protein [Mobiluncus curtisii]
MSEDVQKEDLQKQIDERRTNFCMNLCPGCKAARAKQKGFWYHTVKVCDDKLCPWCAAYYRTQGKRAYEPLDSVE